MAEKKTIEVYVLQDVESDGFLGFSMVDQGVGYLTLSEDTMFFSERDIRDALDTNDGTVARRVTLTIEVHDSDH